MNELHPVIPEPDEHFIDAFEQRLREGIRRRALLDPADLVIRTSSRKGLKMLAIASLVLASMMLGATGTYAVVHQDAAPFRELEVQKASILLERASARLQQRRADLAELEPLVKQGLADTIEEAIGEQQLVEAEAEVQQRELDLQETRLTGRAAANALSAPLVDGRDFVLRRLEARREAANADRRRVQVEFSRTATLAENGLVNDRELLVAKAVLERVDRTLDQLEQSIALRRAFVRGEIAAEEVELRGMLRETEAEQAVAESRLSAARLNMERVEALHKSGAVSDRERREAWTEVRDAESARELAEVQLKLLRQRLEANQEHD